MNEINSVVTNRPAGVLPQAASAPPEQQLPPAVATANEPEGDRVELSAAAARYDAEGEVERALQTRIEDIRARIADGTYLTPDKLEAAISGLLRDLFGE